MEKDLYKKLKNLKTSCSYSGAGSRDMFDYAVELAQRQGSAVLGSPQVEQLPRKGAKKERRMGVMQGVLFR